MSTLRTLELDSEWDFTCFHACKKHYSLYVIYIHTGQMSAVCCFRWSWFCWRMNTNIYSYISFLNLQLFAHWHLQMAARDICLTIHELCKARILWCAISNLKIHCLWSWIELGCNYFIPNKTPVINLLLLRKYPASSCGHLRLTFEAGYYTEHTTYPIYTHFAQMCCIYLCSPRISIFITAVSQ